MFKYNKFIIAATSILLLIITSTGCKKTLETEGLSRVTAYPVFDYQDIVPVPLGGTFTPDGSATEGGSPIDVTVAGTVDVNTPGIYTITYSATNSDGFDGSADQMVVVYDPSITTDISGSYTTAITRTESDGSNPRNYSGEANITLIQPGVFYVDCLLGGTYSIHYGYGNAYAMTGYITLAADNSINLSTSFVQGWGDGLEGFQNGVYDDISGLPYWESIYAGGDIYAVTFSN